MEKLLEVKNLYFAYEDKPVLKDISLSVHKGEKIAVMGANGAGKSTFFLNLNGVLTPYRGEIILKGIKIGKKDKKRLHTSVGFVFQEADSQIIASNVRSEISFGPMNMGLKREEVIKRVDEAICYMGLENFQDRAPHYLSGGEKKKVSIADILAMKSDILIFDEPMTALDPVNAQNTEDILNRLNREGKTLIISTHDSDFAYRFADRIVVFYEGSIASDGTPYEVFTDSEIMNKAHLKKPVMLSIWQSLVDLGIADNNYKYPTTEKEAAEMLAFKYKRKESLK